MLNQKTSRSLSVNQKYQDLYDLLFCQSNPIPVKWMLKQMHFIKSGIRSPLIELDPIHHNEVESILKSLSITNESY